jgi:hypothetical protein
LIFFRACDTTLFWGLGNKKVDFFAFSVYTFASEHASMATLMPGIDFGWRILLRDIYTTRPSF